MPVRPTSSFDVSVSSYVPLDSITADDVARMTPSDSLRFLCATLEDGACYAVDAVSAARKRALALAVRLDATGGRP